MAKKTIVTATDDIILELRALAKEKEGARRKLEVTAKEKESIRGRLEITAKQLAVTAKERESTRHKLEITAKRLATTAKEKEGVRSKLAVAAETLRLKAKQLAVTAKEKEDIKNKLEITAKQLAITAKEKESTRSKLATTAKQLAVTAKERESTRHKLEITAKEKESVRHKLETTAKTLSLKAKQLAVTAKEKESIRGRLEITAKQLAVTAKERESTRHKLEITAKRLATTAKEKEGVRSKLAVAAETLRLKAKQLAVTAKEKEDIKNKLEITAKQLAVTAKEKESTRSKLATTAKQLAVTAKERESTRHKLEITAKRLATTAKEKEGVRSKLATAAETLRLKAKQLAVTAKEKEDIKNKLEITAKQLAITAEKIEFANKYSRSLIEASLDPLVTISPKGKITDVNAATGLVTGLARGKLIGTDFSKYFTEPKKAYEGYKRVFKEGAVIDYPLTIRSKKGELIDVLYNASVYRNDAGKVLGVFAAARDVTEAKKAERIMESANKELRLLDIAKDEFVSIASHQLRTPLTALKGYTGMLLDGDAGPVSEKQKEYLGEIKNANDRMIGLITSLLNVSRVDLGVFIVEPEPIDLKKVAESILKELAVKTEEKKLHIITNLEENLPVIRADLRIIRMIFQNLLSNAVKYTPPEGNISLSIKKNDSNILISVTDTGYGIPEAVQSKIFTKLFRADNARQKDPDGTGLGLYIIKATVEQTGGKIWFESKENQGSTFYVSIPLKGMKKREGDKRLEMDSLDITRTK